MDSDSNEPTTNINHETITPSTLAYIIYTSGSTGLPKGVMVEHISLFTRITSFVAEFSITSIDVGILLLNPAFDASLLETWSILGGGGRLLQLPNKVRVDPTAFLYFCRTHNVTRVVLPASFAERVWKVTDSVRASGKLTLKTMFIGGEQPASFPFSKLPYKVINCYGPTEATIQVVTMDLSSCSSKEFDEEVDIPPIGYPIAGVKLKVQDDELWIGGEGLARGYWNNSALTSEKFVLDGDNHRWYLSGDVVRHSSIYGHYTWLSRLDDQVKLNGFLVEPAEIERVILTRLGSHVVRQVKVVPVEKRILAFVVLFNLEGSDLLATSIDLRKRLAPHFPSFMLPTFFIRVSHIPVTVNGKVDKKELINEYSVFLNTISNTSKKNTPAPLKTWENSLASLWSRVLNLPESVVTATQDIFQIGANSLQLSQFGALLRQKFGLDSNDLLSDGGRYKSSLNIEKMAGIMAKKMKEKQLPELCPNALVPLNEGAADGGKSPIIIFIHPEDGSLFCYNALVHRLAKQGPCYGFQDHQLTQRFKSVKEMATHYVSILETRFELGRPIILCGYSFGGHVAWDMASQLGDAVCPLLIIFDSYSNFFLNTSQPKGGDPNIIYDVVQCKVV